VTGRPRVAQVVQDHRDGVAPARPDGRATVSLEAVLAAAQLTTRSERKFLLPVAALPCLLERLPARMARLEIAGRQIFDYESVYFDTQDLALYGDHVQGRRKRYKARTRTYSFSESTMFEVKLKGLRGQTVKHRMPHEYGRRSELTPEGSAFLDSVVARAYGERVPAVAPVLTTRYRRMTFVDLNRPCRLTIDVGLSWSDGAAGHRADHLALIESKTLSGPAQVEELLGSLGLRPVAISKYCLGVALLHPETPANRWSRLLRHEFGWQRAAALESRLN
jgi:hypothetical protein